MNDRLRLLAHVEQDGSVELIADVRYLGFSGESSAWFYAQEVVTFALALAAAFPLTAPLGIAGGELSGDPAVLTEEQVGVTFYPIGGAGRIGFQVRLASYSHEDTRPSSRRLAHVEMPVTYAQLQEFGPALARLARGEVREVVLAAAGA